MQINNFIGGKFVPPLNGNYLDNHNPATGEITSKIADSSREDVELAVMAAQNALHHWASFSTHERIDWLRKIAKALELRKDEIASVESIDTGKPIGLAKRVDAARSVSNFEFFADHAENLIDKEYRMADATNYVSRKPVGIVGLITPWNLPLYLLTWKIAPALVMGNTIVAKPSELTPLTCIHKIPSRCHQCCSRTRSKCGPSNSRTSTNQSNLIYWWHIYRQDSCRDCSTKVQETFFGIGGQKCNNHS